MNTVKQWMRATRALGFALVLVVDPARVIVESLSADAGIPDVQGTSQSPGHPGHRVVEPASGSFWYAPTDSRRYSF